MIRRKFLQALAAAPAALPVVAKEAAAKMGLEAGAVPAGKALYAKSWPEPDEQQHLLKMWQDFNSETRIASDAEDVRHSSKIIDPDLAALRSVSPAWVMRAQFDRSYENYRAVNRKYLLGKMGAEMRRSLGL